MAEFPALPLWTDAYLGDTTHLSTLEHGAYLLLLMTAWRSRDCALPDDDRILARYARCGLAQWKKLRPILEPFFNVKNGRWTQGRLNDEHRHLSRKREIAAANGRASALKRKGRHSTPREPSESEASTERQLEGQLESNLTTPTPNSVDKSTGADSAENDPESPDFDPVKALFDDGIRVLGRAGTPDKQARSTIGKWRRDFGDQSVALAIAAAETRNISQPMEWIPKRLAAWSSGSLEGTRKSGDIVDIVLAEHGRKPS